MFYTIFFLNDPTEANNELQNQRAKRCHSSFKVARKKASDVAASDWPYSDT